MKQRPLRGISDFVVDELKYLPHSTLFPELVNNATKPLLDSLDGGEVRELINTRMGTIASLDLKIIDAVLAHSGLTAPERLMEFIFMLCGDNVVSSLTYEEIVLANPSDDLRTFTSGDTGITEAFFYTEHQRVEEILSRIIRRVNEAITHLSADGDHLPNVSDASAALDGVVDELNAVIGSVGKLGNMPKGHFENFRQFLNSHPISKLKGPSGAFTARIPTLEILYRGHELPDAYWKYINDNWMYFPKDGREEISKAMGLANQGKTLPQLWRKCQDIEIWAYPNDICRFLDRFRRAHYRAVEKQIPEVLGGVLPGTGGEQNVKEFLLSRVQPMCA